MVIVIEVFGRANVPDGDRALAPRHFDGLGFPGPVRCPHQFRRGVLVTCEAGARDVLSSLERTLDDVVMVDVHCLDRNVSGRVVRLLFQGLLIEEERDEDQQANRQQSENPAWKSLPHLDAPWCAATTCPMRWTMGAAIRRVIPIPVSSFTLSWAVLTYVNRISTPRGAPTRSLTWLSRTEGGDRSGCCRSCIARSPTSCSCNHDEQLLSKMHV